MLIYNFIALNPEFCGCKLWNNVNIVIIWRLLLEKYKKDKIFRAIFLSTKNSWLKLIQLGPSNNLVKCKNKNHVEYIWCKTI